MTILATACEWWMTQPTKLFPVIRRCVHKIYHQSIPTSQHYHQTPPKKWCGLWITKSHKKKRRFLTCSARKRKRCTSRCFEELGEPPCGHPVDVSWETPRKKKKKNKWRKKQITAVNFSFVLAFFFPKPSPKLRKIFFKTAPNDFVYYAFNQNCERDFCESFNSTWQPLGPLLKVKLLVGYMQNPTKLKGAKGIRLT